WRTRAAVHVLVAEPTWKTLSGVASTPLAVLSTPVAASCSRPSCQTAMAAPGTPCSRAASARRSPSSFTAASSARPGRRPGAQVHVRGTVGQFVEHGRHVVGVALPAADEGHLVHGHEVQLDGLVQGGQLAGGL